MAAPAGAPPAYIGANTCFAPSALETTRPGSVVATAVACLLSVIPFFPQYAKFALRRSAGGVSPLMLTLLTLGFWLQLQNLVILHADQIAYCYAPPASLPAGAYACDHSLTTLTYLATSVLAAAPLLPLALHYTPPGPALETGRFYAFALLAAMGATALPTAIGLAAARACAPLAAYAAFLGVLTGLVYVVMYIPQLQATAEARGSESLSYLFLSLHVALGLAAAAQKVFGTHERLLSWAPPLVATAMQAVLLGMLLHYDCEAEKVEKAEKAPLLRSGAAEGGREEAPQVWSREWWLHYL